MHRPWRTLILLCAFTTVGCQGFDEAFTPNPETGKSDVQVVGEVVGSAVQEPWSTVAVGLLMAFQNAYLLYRRQQRKKA